MTGVTVTPSGPAAKAGWASKAALVRNRGMQIFFMVRLSEGCLMRLGIEAPVHKTIQDTGL